MVAAEPLDRVSGVEAPVVGGLVFDRWLCVEAALLLLDGGLRCSLMKFIEDLYLSCLHCLQGSLPRKCGVPSCSIQGRAGNDQKLKSSIYAILLTISSGLRV